MSPLKSVTGFVRKHYRKVSRKAKQPASLKAWRRGGRVFVMSFEGGDRKVIIKDITKNTHIKDPEQLLAVQEYIMSREDRLARSMPRIFAAEKKQGWVIMEYIEGPTLEQVLMDDLRDGEKTRKRDVDLLKDIADLLLAVNQLKLVSAGFSFQPWRNDGVLSRFEPVFRDAAIRRYLPQGMNTLEKFYSRFGPDFFSRTHDELVLVDSQPKNILAPACGPLRLIDLDYTITNPALGVAHFLISLDRLGLDRPFPSRIAKISSWQRQFVSEYMNGAGPSFAESLVFFYPSTLLRVYSLHARERPFLARYLGWYYGNRLNRFLKRLEEVPRRHYHRSVPDLFADPS